MATSNFWQRMQESVSAPSYGQENSFKRPRKDLSVKGRFWMYIDVLTVIFCAAVAVVLRYHGTRMSEAKGFWYGASLHGRSMWIVAGLVCGFTFALIMTSRRLHLYTPIRFSSYLHEQRLSVQACLYSGLLLTGALYLIHSEEISRAVVFGTIGLVTLSLSMRRFSYRVLINRRFERGEGTRNVLIVGMGPEAHALRHHLESIRHLGYTFKGFIDFAGRSGSEQSPFAAGTSDVVGTMDTLFDNARKHFVDEIFFTAPCEREIVHGVLEQARTVGVDLRVVPDMYDGLAWNRPIEYIGQFPTIPLHSGHVPEMGLLLKRAMDVLLAGFTMIVLAPVMVAISIAVKLDSPGPVFYAAERIGKKGLRFRCFKFRTMVRDADKKRADIMHMNEREGILFKITNDPRITKLGRLLRRYSLDELPQFLNVLRGDMSLVGPRPPLASEVREYKLSHLRRLDVMPGITGLWQVQARQDPSFDNYISLDVTYVDNWSIWLDLKILVRTVGVVLTGTGS